MENALKQENVPSVQTLMQPLVLQMDVIGADIRANKKLVKIATQLPPLIIALIPLKIVLGALKEMDPV